jgi:acyl carrier protein
VADQLDLDSHVEAFAAEFRLDSCPADARLVEDLGFDSLQMLQLVYFLEDRFGVELDETRIPFADLTVRDTHEIGVVAAAGG